MSLNIISFRYCSEDSRRWKSETINFADNFTMLMGDNGTGKTPMLSGMAFAMGYPLDLPPEIKENVDHTELVLSHNNKNIIFTRKIQENFEIVVEENNTRVTITSEREFSDFLFDLFKIDVTVLSPIRAQGKGIKPYISNFLPLIWIRQSTGWTYIYQPLKNQRFIKDQQEEMIRMLLNISPKHPFSRKKLYENKKIELEAVKNRIEVSQKSLEELRGELGDLASKPLSEVENEKSKIKFLLTDARNRLGKMKSGTDEIDAVLSEKRAELFRLEQEKSSLTSKINSLESAYDELDGETEVLESNEVAVDEFRVFCGMANCKLFEKSRKLYGKRLLYLRDQLKDIKTSQNYLRNNLGILERRIKEKQDDLLSLEHSKKESQKESGTEDILSRIDELGNRYSDMNEEYRKIRSFRDMQDAFYELINRKTSLEEDVKSLRPTGRRDNSRLGDVLSVFRDNFENWLGILNTPNIVSSSIDESFNAIINDVRFSEDSFQDGSTRARIVLAYIAALAQTAHDVNGNHPGFIFLDTPRQHELHMSDLEQYFTEFRKLMNKMSLQVVIACKDAIFTNKNTDKFYVPKFDTITGARYLGTEN